MADALLPLFPLGVVLFPDTMLPLHIFEERYKEMIATVLQDDSEFGVVLALDRGIVSTGCTARVTRVVEQYEDGQLDILTMGQRRFEVESLDHERAFLRGGVNFFLDEVAEAPLNLRRHAIEVYRKAFPDPGAERPVAYDSPQLSFQLAQVVADLNTRQTLLQMRSEEERLRRLLEVLPALGQRQEIEGRLRKRAPLNGHSKHLT